MKKLSLGLGLVFLLSAGLLAGCGNSKDTTAKEIDKLTIVQMPDENNPDAGTKNEEFRKDMSDALGVEVEELEGGEYSVGIEAMKAGKLDVLLVSPMSYYQAKKIANVEPLVTTTSMGEVPYKTDFIVSKDDTKTKNLADLKGKTFAFVDPASSSGYMFPKAKLVQELGLNADKLENPGYFFESVTYSGKHDSSVVGVAKGDYQAAAVTAQIIPDLVEAGLINEGDVRVVGETDVIPNACYVIRADLPQEMKEKIKEFYLGYENEAYFESFYGDKGTRFIEAKDEDYKVIDEMVKALNLEEE
ncbi:phosphate/phosphite/phosphonate ABC transporter substrate-binding protein [Enterococcus saccharolyticus]|uniref:phosphate/phosphite/phosphonate ABC transporter substrate-binding protein n=1 Tax=Enterococcus TaxID=1350 RepID=UPI001E36B7F5|nr:phosphate/phosphite/phosphonate ABC transporter substrate-binding protein [Enterococcus saccharolyticus]MCD5001584.1 phosphate/phosphite/phosphonate ABC transporter substrate-binding protein [Enterococcus saccharolyticus]